MGAPGEGRVRVVVTGLGAVSAWGWGADALWSGLASGRTAVRGSDRFDTSDQRTHIVAEVPPAPPGICTGPGARHNSRADHFAVAAALESLRQAGEPTTYPADSVGVFLGGSTAGMPECESFFRQFRNRGSDRTSVELLRSQQLHCPGDQVARALGLSGPVESYSSACASGALAISAAVEAVRTGEVESAIAGGADALCRLTYSGFNALRAIDAEPCRPFRADRAGLSLGEGAGVVYLESLVAARKRGVAALVEVLGTGSSCDAYHMTAPHPAGTGAALAMSDALRDAGVDASHVAFVNCHGTGTPHNDASEACAIREVFGDRASELPATSTKSSVGHLLGSSGAIEAVATALCLLAREVHPTAGPCFADPELGLDLVVGCPRTLGSADGAEPLIALSTSFGFGGVNAAIVLSEVL